MRVAWWWIPVALIAAALGTWVAVTRTSSDTIRELRAETAEWRARNEARDSVQEELEDSIAVLGDSVTTIRAKKDTVVRVRVVEARARVDTASRNLREYMAGDTLGLALLAHLEEAHEAETTELRYALTLAEAEAALERDRVHMLQSIVAGQDSSIAELELLHSRAIEEAERWYRKANPPLAIRFAGGAVEGAVVGLATYGVSQDGAAAVVAGLSSALAKPITRILGLP